MSSSMPHTTARQSDEAGAGHGIALQVSNLSKSYALFNSPRDRLLQFFMFGGRQLYHWHHALQKVNFTIRKGETVGIIGHNGSGKSTLLQLLCGTLAPDPDGSVEITGRISALLELGAGFNPEYTGEENLFLYGSVLGFTRAEMKARYDEIIQFAAIGEFIHQPVKFYSSGMVVRLAFAIAVAVDPDILVVDEALAVGDEAFQSKCYARIRAMQEAGATILFVSHSARIITEICSRALLLDQGELLRDGAPREVIAQYQRLVYAAPQQREAIREAIRRGDVAREEAIPHAPESQLHYTPHGATIVKPRIETLEGEVSHLLETGKSYVFRYDVLFEQQTSQVRYGMMIKTPGGVEISGVSGGEESLNGADLQTAREVKIYFTCLMTSGHYFINAGVTSHDDQGFHYLHRIVDAAQFTVTRGNAGVSDHVAGLVDLDGRVLVQRAK